MPSLGSAPGFHSGNPLLRHAIAPTAVYRAGGYRSSIAASALRAGGFTTVADVLGGFGAWSAAGLPVDGSQRPEDPGQQPSP